MKNVKLLTAMGLLTMTGIAQADISGTAAVVTDYDWRGWTQTDYSPALQLSLDYTNDFWYAGVWGSNVGNGGSSNPSTELDFYTGFSGELESGIGWDVGLIYYAFPGASDGNAFEIYGTLSYGFFSGTLYITDDYFGADESAYYLSLDAGIPVGPVSLDLHAGLSDGDAFGFNDPADGYTDGYIDYSIGVSYTANNFTLGIKWVTQDSDDAVSDDRVILSLSTAFPW